MTKKIPDKDVSTENSTDNGKEVKKKWIEVLREHQAEFIIAVSTTLVMTQIPLQKLTVAWMRKQPWIMTDLKQYGYLFQLVRAPLPQLLLYLIIPLITMLLFRKPIRDYGMRIGDFKKGLLWVVICVGALAPLLFWASRMPDFTRYYVGRLKVGFLWLVLQYGLYMLSWEFLFRGYLYFPLEERVGPTLAIFIQSIPFAVAHLGKPATEAITCYFGGLVLGYISYKTRSFIYAFLIHWGIYVTLLGFIALKLSAPTQKALMWMIH